MKNIYLDNAATTKVEEKVAKRVNEFFSKNYGNASSQHSLGRKAREGIEKAREEIAKIINAEKDEIIFTSGGTESNNLAIKGIAVANPDKRHIITSVIEHPCILETCKELEKQGYNVDYISVNKDGIININELKSKITEQTLLVSIMHVNNEIGTIQPIEEIGKICKSKNVLFHTDAVQGFCKQDIDVKIMNLDLLSASGHKINAPKGIGFLYIKKGIKISPIFNGGGQEKGIRSGTENVPGIIGLAEAINVKKEKDKIKKIRDYMIKELSKINGSIINGSIKERIYNNINVSFYGIEGESLLLLLDKEGIYVSTGSACSSHKLEESHVLKAISIPSLYIHGSIRLTLDPNKAIPKATANHIIDKIKESVEKLRKISPFKLDDETKDKKIRR